MQTNTAPVATNPKYDERGNYSNDGDLHRTGENFDDMIPRMIAHLGKTFPGYGFSPQRKIFAGGRSLTMNVISGPAGLSDPDAAEEFVTKLRQQMERFDRSKGNVLSDFHTCSFYAHAYVDPRYHAQHADVAVGTHVDPTMTLTAFRRAIKVGDSIVLEASNQTYSQRMIGVEREILEVRSKDFITAKDANGGRVYFDYPKAAAFACDGERFRVTDASEHQPDAYRLYRWIRS